MSWIDILFILIAILAIYRGYKNGFVVEICGVLGIVIGGYVAYKFSGSVADALDMEFAFAREVAFVVTMILVVVVIMMLAKALSRLLSSLSLGVINSLLGSVASLFKVMLVVSLICTAFNAVNDVVKVVPKDNLQKSKAYYPVLNLSTIIFPYVDFLSDYYDRVKKHVETKIENPDKNNSKDGI